MESVLSIAVPPKRQKRKLLRFVWRCLLGGGGLTLKLQAILLTHLGLYRFKLWLLEGCKAGLFQSVQKSRRLAGPGPCEELGCCSVWGLQGGVFILPWLWGLGRLRRGMGGSRWGQRHGTGGKLCTHVLRSQLRALHKHLTTELYHQPKF